MPRHRSGAPAVATTVAPPNAGGVDDDDANVAADCDRCLPLAVVEVVPLHMVPVTLDGALADPGPPPLSAPMVKMQLRTMTTVSLATRTRRGLSRCDSDCSDEDDDGDNDRHIRKRRDRSDNDGDSDDGDGGGGGGDMVMRIAFDSDSPDLGESNTDELSKDMKSLSLGTTTSSSKPAMHSSSSNAAVQVQPAITRIVGGNIFLSDPNWDDAIERRIIESANGRAIQSKDTAATTTTPQMPIIRILSDDPTDFSDGVPCWVRGYASITAAANASSYDKDDNDDDEPGDALDCAVVAGTLVRILPTITARVVSESDGSHEECGEEIAQGELTTLFEGHPTLEGGAPLPLPLFTELSGEVDPYQLRLDKTGQEEIDFILACHDDEAVRGLLVRMQALLERDVLVGTTDDAIALWEAKRTRTRRRRCALQSHLMKSSSAIDAASVRRTSGFTADDTTDATNSCGNLFRDGALIVHNPYELSGKTLLVETLARHVLKCSAVHTLDATTLFAQYGANGADIALESLLHSIVLSAAVGGGRLGPDHRADIDKNSSVPSICIVLDHLETFVPPSMLGISGSTGDPTVPALNAIVAYLTKLTKSIQNRGHFPYPTKNPMYNIDASVGFVMPVRTCIVGIVTAPDDGGRSGVGSPGDAYTILDVLGSNRYRLSQPSARTRHRAFCRAFEEAKIQLSTEAKEALPVIAASTTSARGRDFRKVAKQLLFYVSEKEGGRTKMREATAVDVRKAMKIVPKDAPKDSSIGVTFLSSKTGRAGASKGGDMFATVGGNADAKLALEDALALDPKKRRILSAFGLSPPVGVLLFGPPGTGKTLLAKATALALESESPIGGAFINLQASDIVMGAVGQSEKLVVSSFELARQNTPAVIFIDEMETLFTARGGTGGSQLASTLLQCMDDVSRWRDADEKAKEQKARKGSAIGDGEDIFDADKGRIIILGATNVPWMIDKAFLRPGRFDRVVHVGLPNQEERESILQVHIGNMKINVPDDDKDIARVKDELCKQLAKDTDGLSGADIFALCRDAAIRCIRDKDSTVEGGVKEIHFLEASEEIEPSCDEKFVRKLLNWSPRGRN